MSKKSSTFAVRFDDKHSTMIDRSVHMIFESSGMPVPSEEEVQFEAREIVQRSGWGLPLIERLRKMSDPYWREAVARCLLHTWLEMVENKDEQTYYYDGDGDVRYCWMDAECDFRRIIRKCTDEQVELEHTKPDEPEENVPFYSVSPHPTEITQELNHTNESMQQIIHIEKPTVGQNFGSVTINNYYPQPVAEPTPQAEDKVSKIPPTFFCVSARFPEEDIRERLDAELASASTKIDYCRSLYRLQHMGCIDIQQYSSDAQRAKVFNEYQSTFKLSASDFCKARMVK